MQAVRPTFARPLLLSLCLAWSVAQAETPPAADPVVADNIQKGDVCDQKLQASEALRYYLPVEKVEPNNPKLLVCIARQYRHLMSDASNKEEKLKLANKALSYSQRAAAAGPNDSAAQLDPAITYGKMTLLLGKKEQVANCRKIRESAERAIKLDPSNDLAWHVLGRWHMVVADVGVVSRTLGGLIYGSLPATTNEDAVNCFRKAIELNPNRLMHYVELGETYAHMGRAADAKRMINKGLSMPCEDKDDPEMKRRGRETLASLH